MNRKVDQRRWLFLLGATWACFVMESESVSAKVTGNPELLEQVLVTHTSNMEKLVTWSGEAEVVVHSTGKRGTVDRKAHVVFAVDRQEDAWLYRWDYQKTGSDLDGAKTGGMFLDNTWHWYMPYLPDQKVNQGLVVRPGRDHEQEIGPMSSVFDPMYYFKVRNHDLKNEMDTWVPNLDSDWLDITISRDGDVVTVTPLNVNVPYATAQYVFDLAQGGNLASVRAKDDLREEHWETTWQQKAGVWIPKRASYQNKTLDGTQDKRKVVTWQQSDVNQVLAKNTFTLENLQVAKGALVSDHRAGKSWHYQEPTRDQESTIEVTDRRWRRFTLIVVNLAAVLILFGAVRWRRATRGESNAS